MNIKAGGSALPIFDFEGGMILATSDDSPSVLQFKVRILYVDYCRRIPVLRGS
jgi:hypothetical protein